MRILTWNLEWGGKKNSLIGAQRNAVIAERPDIAILTEVPPDGATRFTRDLRTAERDARQTTRGSGSPPSERS